MIDLRSYGFSGGARGGHNLLEFQNDVYLLLRQARDDLPCFLWGHSMGGLLVTTLCINNPTLNIAGAVISAPLFDTSSAQLSWLKEKLLGLLSGAMNEGVFNSYIAPSCLSRDDVYTKNIYSDSKLMPLYGARLGRSIYDHMQYAKLHAKDFKHPAIFFHGKSDALTSLDATKKVFEKSTSKDKTFKELPRGYHEPHNDIDRDKFLAESMAWITERLKGKNFGIMGKIQIGMAGLPKESHKCRYLTILFIIVYLIVAWKVKVKFTPAKLFKMFGYLSKLFWPLALIFR